MKTIDLTPTWEQWMNVIMTIALKTKDPAKVLEPVSEDFKNVAKLADIGKRYEQEGKALLEEALNALNSVPRHAFHGSDGLDSDTYALASKLGRYLKGEQVLDIHLNGDNDQPTTCPQCGSRTDFVEISETKQHHGCLSYPCGYEFILEMEEE